MVFLRRGYTLSCYRSQLSRNRLRSYADVRVRVQTATVGAFLGGVVDFFFADIIEWLSSINGVLNIFPPIIATVLLLSIFAYLSERKDTYD